MKSLKNYHFAIIAIALLWSCQKEGRENVGEKNEVQFFAYFNETPFTKAPPFFSLGNKATVYAFTADTEPTTPIIGTPLEVTCQTNGLLTTNTPLYLQKGAYDFYSVSLNNATAPGLSFTAGVSEQLTNDKDYLWAKADGINQGGTVTFAYKHKATALEIIVSPGSGVTNLSVSSIKITPSKPESNSKMTLKTGEILSSTQTDTLTEIDVNGSKAVKIMLPLQSKAIAIEVTVSATIGGTPVTNKKYSTTLPIMTYDSGSYYSVSLCVDAQAIRFTGAKLEDWAAKQIMAPTLIEQ